MQIYLSIYSSCIHECSTWDQYFADSSANMRHKSKKNQFITALVQVYVQMNILHDSFSQLCNE